MSIPTSLGDVLKNRNLLEKVKRCILSAEYEDYKVNEDVLQILTEKEHDFLRYNNSKRQLSDFFCRIMLKCENGRTTAQTISCIDTTEKILKKLYSG